MIDKTKERRIFIINVLYYALAAAILYYSVKYALGWVLPFIIGFLVALMVKPGIRFLYRKLKVPQKVSAIILVLLFYAIVGFLLFLVGAKLILILQDIFNSLPDMYDLYLAPQITDLIIQFKELTERLDPSIAQLIQNATSSIVDSSGSLVSGLSTKVLGYLSTTVISLPSVLLFILFAIISSVFFAMDFSKITGYITGMLPEKMQERMTTLRAMAADLGTKYIKSYAIIISITFIELSIGLLILGVDNAIGLAALIAFIDLLPVLGTGAVIIPWILITLIMGNYGLTIGLAVLYVVIIVVRNIMEPRLVGRQIGIHPLAMLASMYVGLQIFGFIGIFVLPLVLLVVKGFHENKADTPGDNPDQDRPDQDSPDLDKPVGETGQPETERIAPSD